MWTQQSRHLFFIGPAQPDNTPDYLHGLGPGLRSGTLPLGH